MLMMMMITINNNNNNNNNRTWEDNTEMDLGEMRSDTGDWIDLAQDRVQWRA